MSIALLQREEAVSLDGSLELARPRMAFQMCCAAVGLANVNNDLTALLLNVIVLDLSGLMSATLAAA